LWEYFFFKKKIGNLVFFFFDELNFNNSASAEVGDINNFADFFFGFVI
jgi:hypothetical protein